MSEELKPQATNVMQEMKSKTANEIALSDFREQLARETHEFLDNWNTRAEPKREVSEDIKALAEHIGEWCVIIPEKHYNRLAACFMLQPFAAAVRKKALEDALRVKIDGNPCDSYKNLSPSEAYYTGVGDVLLAIKKLIEGRA